MPLDEILVVVDVQPSYGVCPKVIQPCLGEVNRAMKAKRPIALVKYVVAGDLHPDLLKATADYPHVKIVEKHQRDGSGPIISAFPEKARRYRLCGIYAACCVLDTAIGLKQKIEDTQILIMLDAIDGDSNMMKQMYVRQGLKTSRRRKNAA